MRVFTGYRNYGCLGSEKREKYTEGIPSSTASCSDKIKMEVPEGCGWELYETVSGSVGVITPWGQNYLVYEVLVGNKYPYFEAYDNEMKLHRVRLNCYEE